MERRTEELTMYGGKRKRRRRKKKRRGRKDDNWEEWANECLGGRKGRPTMGAKGRRAEADRGMKVREKTTGR